MNNTIFDDVFRTMIEKMPYLAVPLINEVFHTSYPEDVKITQLRNEHQQKDGEIITDSCLLIGKKMYHIECQSTDDTTMAIRMIEYDFAIAVENAEKQGRRYRIEFPRSCVLFLRSSGNTPDYLEADVIFPDGKTHVYSIPAIKMADYTKDHIFEKNLLMLLPFYIMRYEKMKQQLENDEVLREKLFQEYEMIAKYLEQKLLNCGLEKEFRDMRELISRIVEYSFPESKNIRKGLGEIMGGQVLELESDRLIKKGEQLGEARGKELGAEQMASLTKKLLQENRLNDLRRCTEDSAYRKKLLNEMQGIL